MDKKEIIDKVLKCNVSQNRLGNYLGITRQTVSKISKGGYASLSEYTKSRFQSLENKSKDDIENLITISEKMGEILDRVLRGDSKYLSAAYEGIKYMNYWIVDEKFIDQEKYHTYYFAHMNNFYPRYNQTALFMRDIFNRQKYPLVTYQVDYKSKQIINFCIKEFLPKYKIDSYDVSNVEMPLSFENFLIELEKRIHPSFKFLVYLDYEDDDWEFIINNLKKNDIKLNEIFDLSRLFNILNNEQALYGPLIEDVLDQFKVDYDLGKLLCDSSYRADKIVEVVNIASLEDINERKRDKTTRLFDSHGLKRDIEYMKKERRKRKRGINL